MRTDWRLVGLLYLVGLLAAGQFAKLALSLPALAGRYPDAPLALAVSAQSLTGVLFGVVAGSMVARLGPRRALLGGLLAGALLSSAQALLPPFPLLLALRVLEGGAHLALVVAAPTLMAAVAAPRDVPVTLGLWGTFFGVGFALAAVAVPALGTPPRLFLVHAGALLLLAAALWPLLPRVGRGAAPLGEGWIARHRRIYAAPRLMAPALGFVWHTVAFLGILTFLPRFLGAWSGPVLPLVALVGTLGAGLLARRIPPLLLAQGGLAGGFAVAFAMLLAPPELGGVLALPLFLCLGIVPGASFAAVPELNADPADRARANGALAQLGNCGTALSTPLFAWGATGGVPGLLGLALGVAAAGVVVLAIMRRLVARIPVTARRCSANVP